MYFWNGKYWKKDYQRGRRVKKDILRFSHLNGVAECLLRSPCRKLPPLQPPYTHPHVFFRRANFLLGAFWSTAFNQRRSRPCPLFASSLEYPLGFYGALPSFLAGYFTKSGFKYFIMKVRTTFWVSGSICPKMREIWGDRTRAIMDLGRRWFSFQELPEIRE